MEELKSILWITAFCLSLKPMVSLLEQIRATYLTLCISLTKDEHRLTILSSMLPAQLRVGMEPTVRRPDPQKALARKAKTRQSAVGR
jgi:hypothetical protein